MNYQSEEYADGKGRMRHGSPIFYDLLERMAKIHDKKSHDYASNDNPSGNYHFAGKLALLFSHSEQDAGFIGRLGEKIYRLANLEGSQKTPSNESIEDTELDICVITAFWMADRKDRRTKNSIGQGINPEYKDEDTLKMKEEKRQEAMEIAVIQATAEMTLPTLNNSLRYLEALKENFERYHNKSISPHKPESPSQR